MNAGTNRKSLRAEFERVVDAELPRLMRTAELVLKDPGPAADLVVEAVGEAYRRRDLLPAPVSSLRPELYRAMVDVMFSRFLPWASYGTAFGLDQFEEPAPCDELATPRLRAISSSELDGLVREVPHPLRLIAVLSLVSGFSYADISYITGLHIDTVRSRMKRGRSLLGRLVCREMRTDRALQPERN